LSASPLNAALFALAGGAIAWIVLQVCHPMFGNPAELLDTAKQGRTFAEQQSALAAAIPKANRYDAMLALAVVGALVGGGLGMAELVAHRSRKPVIIIATVVATFIGASAGVVGGLLGDLLYVSIKPAMEPLSLSGTVQIQLVTLGVLGAGIGLGLGAATGRILAAGYCLFVGLLAGLGAGLLYPVILAFVLPGVQTQLAVPYTGSSRLLWIALIAGLLGLIVPGTATRRPLPAVGTPLPASH
jgi:hypothetical protein